MKSAKKLPIQLLCLLLLLGSLCGCGSVTADPKSDDPAETNGHTTQITPDATLSADPGDMTETAPPPADAPIHSELFIPGVSADDVILYFQEVCLDAEFVNSGDASRVQKWTSPIYYTLHGDPTAEDLAVLESFSQWLNAMPGFPGIHEAEDPALANLHIHFCSEAELLSLMGDQYIGNDGAVTFWYQDDAIYDAIICCRTDLDQSLRNSVILEELYNCLGPVQDTSLREDSIIFAGFSSPQELTPVDQLLLRLLYHPQILCGMDAAECEAVIRSLYY